MKRYGILAALLLWSMLSMAQWESMATLKEAKLKGPVHYVHSYSAYDYGMPWVQVWAYNEKGNLTHYVSIINDDVRETHMEYDESGRQLTKVDNGYSVITYTYRSDSALMKEEEIWPGSPEINRLVLYTRNKKGQILTEEHYKGGQLDTHYEMFYNRKGRKDCCICTDYRSGEPQKCITRYTCSGDSIFRSEQYWYMPQPSEPYLYQVGDSLEYDRVMARIPSKDTFEYDHHGNWVTGIFRGEDYIPADTVRRVVRYYGEEPDIEPLEEEDVSVSTDQ